MLHRCVSEVYLIHDKVYFMWNSILAPDITGDNILYILNVSTQCPAVRELFIADLFGKFMKHIKSWAMTTVFASLMLTILVLDQHTSVLNATRCQQHLTFRTLRLDQTVGILLELPDITADVFVRSDGIFLRRKVVVLNIRQTVKHRTETEVTDVTACESSCQRCFFSTMMRIFLQLDGDVDCFGLSWRMRPTVSPDRTGWKQLSHKLFIVLEGVFRPHASTSN